MTRTFIVGTVVIRFSARPIATWRQLSFRAAAGICCEAVVECWNNPDDKGDAE